MPAPEPVGTRIGRKLAQSGTCITWTGAIRPNGYGVVGGTRHGKNWYDSPHRVVYELTHGAIPHGLHLDHLCRNRACVNPDHLEAVSRGENNQRSWDYRKGRPLPQPRASRLTAAALARVLTGVDLDDRIAA